MKNLIYLILLIIISCNKPTQVKQEHTTESYQDMIDDQLHPNTLSKNTLKEIKNFKPFVQDIVWYVLTYPDDLEITEDKFKTNHFCLYVGLGYDYFDMFQSELVLTEDEKKYLWRLYLDTKHKYLKKVRIYEWENPNLK